MDHEKTEDRKMALGAGLAFLMAVSLTGCEMDRMDQRQRNEG
ncbi:MAG: hypothetical protein ACLU8D_06200 [Enterocloster sp.]